VAYVPDEAIDRMDELSSGAWKLYCFLCRCRNHASGKCNPSSALTAKTIGVHTKNVFRLRRELTVKGWASFTGDSATWMIYLSKNPISEQIPDGSKNATTGDAMEELTPQSSKNATVDSEDGSKNATGVAKMLLNGSKNATAYKEEPAKEPCNNNVVVLRARVSAESEQREYLSLAKQNGHTNGNGKAGNHGIHLYADYLDYVTATKPGKGTAQAIGLARWMQKQGEDDEAVAAWLKSKQSPAQKPKPAACPTCGGRGFNRRPTPTDPINNQLCETCNGKGHALQAAV
jgi:hypothetical protein